MKGITGTPLLALIMICLSMPAAGLPGQEALPPEQDISPPEQDPPPPEQDEARVTEIKTGSYAGIGKRDPFMSLLNIREEDRTKVVPPPPLEERPPGLPGLLISEVSVAGVATGNTKKVIVLKGIDGGSYIAEPGSPLFDGVLEEVNEEGVIFSRTEETSDGRKTTFKVTKPFNSSEKQVLP